MLDLAKYSFINAKIRAMLSSLITQDIFSSLLESRDIYEALDILKETPYKDIVEKFSSASQNLSVLEKEFLRNDLNIYRKVYDAIPTKREKEFVFLLMERYELEELKLILRIWHKKVAIKLEDYLLGEKINYTIDFEKILRAQTIEEIILLLDNTPYKKPLLASRDKFKEKKSIFYLEAPLDADYYERLMLSIDGFSSVDKRIAKKILGIEIDIANISWVIRLEKYYSMAMGEILPWVIPGGDRINKDNVINLYGAGGLSNVVDTVAFGPYIKIKDLIEENVNLIENFLYEILLREVRRVLAGFPFTIGIILGYLILKHRETKNIISLLYAKKYGLKKEEVGSLLNI